jgi:predicted nucleotidyltransferase
MAEAKLSQRRITKLINSLVNDLEAEKIKVNKVILYGSYARGNPKNFSDIDIAVISPSFTRKNLFKIQEELAKVLSKYLSRIEPIGFSPEQYESADLTSFLGEIKRTGKVIYSAPLR